VEVERDEACMLVEVERDEACVLVEVERDEACMLCLVMQVMSVERTHRAPTVRLAWKEPRSTRACWHSRSVSLPRSLLCSQTQQH